MRVNPFVKLGFALALSMFLVATAPAGDEITVTGKIMCAKCTLKKADATACQDVLVVEGEDGAVTEYYVEKNKVAEDFGHTCQGTKPVSVTGTVAENDGKTWIAPTKMVQSES